MLPLAMFRSRTFAAANLYTLLLYAALGGSTFFIPYAMIDAQQYAPAAAGAVMLPFVVLRFVLSPWAGGLVTRFGPGAPLGCGAGAAARRRWGARRSRLHRLLAARPRRIVLDDLLPAGARPRLRGRALHRAAHADGLRRRGGRAQRDGLGDQQRGRSRRRFAR